MIDAMASKIRVYGKAQNRTVLGIINAYLVMYPHATLADLRKAFPDSLNNWKIKGKPCMLLVGDKEIDQLIGDKKWTAAFDKTKQYYDEDAKRTKKAEIQTVFVDDFITKISELNENNYDTKSKQLIRDLDNVKNYIGDNYDSLKSSIESKKPPQQTPPKTSYSIELWKGNREVYSKLKLNHDRNADGKVSITRSCTIDANSIHGIVFCLVDQNGNAQPLKLNEITSQGVQCSSQTSGWIDVTQIENNATIKIVKAGITITFTKEL